MVVGWWEKVVHLAIRPPRAKYNFSDLPGPKFTINGRVFLRRNINVVSPTGGNLVCSHYVPLDQEDTPLPCVVYLHGNSGCQRDACEVLRPLLSANITVFAFDFTGSGRSDGEFITLGINESKDMEAVIKYLRSCSNVSKVALWGRSMGAATAVLYTEKDPSIAGLVLDSAFSRFNDLAVELVESYSSENGIWFPRAMIKLVLGFFRRSVKSQTGADIDKLDVLAAAGRSFIPARFGCASGDTFVQAHHTERLHAAYQGDKQLVHFEGEHNGLRPAFFYDSSSIFLHNILQPPEVPSAAHPKKSKSDKRGGRPSPPPPAISSSAPATTRPTSTRPTSTSRLDLDMFRDSIIALAENGGGSTRGASPSVRKGIYTQKMQLREEDVGTIEAMGFTRSMAVAALQRHPNVHFAANYLLEGGMEFDDDDNLGLQRPPCPPASTQPGSKGRNEQDSGTFDSSDSGTFDDTAGNSETVESVNRASLTAWGPGSTGVLPPALDAPNQELVNQADAARQSRLVQAQLDADFDSSEAASSLPSMNNSNGQSALNGGESALVRGGSSSRRKERAPSKKKHLSNVSSSHSEGLDGKWAAERDSLDSRSLLLNHLTLTEKLAKLSTVSTSSMESLPNETNSEANREADYSLDHLRMMSLRQDQDLARAIYMSMQSSASAAESQRQDTKTDAEATTGADAKPKKQSGGLLD